MTPAERLRGVLTPQLITLATKLLRSYYRREGIRPNDFLRDEVESAAFFGVATVLDAISKGITPDNPVAYATVAIVHEMQRASIEDAQPRCQFSDEYGPNQVVDGDHQHQPYGDDDEPIDWLDRFTDPIDRQIATEISLGTPRAKIAKIIGINPSTVFRRLPNIRRLASA